MTPTNELTEAAAPPVTNEQPVGLTQADLARGVCKKLGCDHTSHGATLFRATCHRHASFDLAYFGGILTVRCGRCSLLVNRIAVAP